MNKCPICGKEYSESPALSRIDDHTLICPRCGVREALQAAGFSEDTIDVFLAFIFREDEHNED